MLKVNCPYCHRPSLEDISIEDISHIDPSHIDPIDLKIDEVHHKIQQLDKTVEQLSKNRTDLLEELNEIQPFIGVLPQEILSRIFQFACSPPEFGSFFSKTDCDLIWEDDDCSSVGKAQVLTKVSAGWRRTVMATPQVWTCLTLHIKRSTFESRVHFLRQFLEYSGHLPLTLCIYLSAVRFDADVLIHRSIDALLVKHLWRIKNLRLNSPPQTWYSHLPQLTQLSHLLLINSRRPPPEVPLNQVSSLSELTFFCLPIIFSSPHITTLNLHEVPPRAIFRTLTNCPNLIKLYIRMSDPNMAHNEDGSNPVERFTLQHLEVFEWTVSSDPWETALLNHLHLPSLQSLSFIHPPCSWPENSTQLQEAATNFFANLPTTLKSLELCVLRDPNVEIYILDFPTLVNNDLRDDCQIESITLASCHSTLATDILLNLTRPQRLPQLSRITLHQIWWDREHMTFVLRAFLEAVEKRLSGCERPLSLYLMKCNVHVNVEWFDCIRSELEELKRRGCEAKIFFESMQVI